ncbi:MAG: phtD [Herbaspirillum sp.]|jgi:4,5-dihydroxyphthalate decarboxylase|nr:phtD [Herbaspirillum sp.]
MQKLKTALQTLGHTSALKDGTVKPQTFEFEFEEVQRIIQAFRRMVRGTEFDISEMAITTYLSARAYGKPFTALPIFLIRAFHHGAIVHHSKLGIVKTPKDLEGKKVGLGRGYTVTAGVWARSVLQHEYGVDLNKITWVRFGEEHVAEFQPPANVVNAEPGKTAAEMLASGELAAVIGGEFDDPDVKTLIPDAAEAGYKALRERGHYPINHTLVVRDELLAAHPGLAQDIFNAFAAAKRPYLERLRNGQIANPTKNDKTAARVLEITGADPLPYGIEPNRKMLEAVIGYAVEQNILTRPYTVEELFAAGTHDLVA